MRRDLAVALALAVPLAGCLISDTRHTIYLSPDGAVTWVVREEGIRSDEDARLDREREEQEMLDRFAAGRHPMAEALDALLPRRLNTRQVRAVRPYSIRTTAEFGSVQWVLEDLCAGIGLPARVELDTTGDERRLTVAVRPEEAARDEEGEDARQTEVLAPLFGPAESYEIVLTEGRFVDATIFVLDDSQTSARLPAGDLGELANEDGELVFSLAWVVDEE